MALIAVAEEVEQQSEQEECGTGEEGVDLGLDGILQLCRHQHPDQANPCGKLRMRLLVG